MKTLAAFAMGLFFGLPAIAQVTPPITRMDPAVTQMEQSVAQRPTMNYDLRRDLATERSVFEKSDEIGAALQPTARIRRDQAAKRVRTQLATAPADADPFLLAQQEVRRQFGPVREDQLDVLSFSVLAEAVRGQKATDSARNAKDSLSEMGEAESLRLQMAMDRLSKLMSTLSNELKKASETASSITQNMK
jgi:hypothetical protein